MRNLSQNQNFTEALKTWKENLLKLKIEKWKKKSENKIQIPNFKKDTNLIDLKESLDNYRKSKSKKKQRTEVKKSSTNNNRNLKNIQIKKKE